MKTARTLLPMVLALFPVVTQGQSASLTSATHQMTTSAATVPDAQKWFDQLKTLGGEWSGAVTTDPKVPQMAGSPMNVTMRVTSMGNAIMHNMRSGVRPDDPITMIYMENGRLYLTHYCDSGNRPRMEGKISADGKSVTFDMVDIVGPTTYGHMDHAVFTFIDADHHIEDWTYVMGSNKTMQAHFDLRRAKPTAE